MDGKQKYVNQISIRIFIALIIFSLFGIAIYWLFDVLFEFEPFLRASLTALLLLIAGFPFTAWIADMLSRPMFKLRDTILYQLHPEANTEKPNLSELQIGKDMIDRLTNLILQSEIAESKSHTKKDALEKASSEEQKLLQALSPAVLAVDTNGNLAYANHSAFELFEIANDVFGQQFDSVMRLEFSGDQTYADWLDYCHKNKIVDQKILRRVRVLNSEKTINYTFDVAASFTKDSKNGIETVLLFFDETERYDKEDQEIGFISLAVHELRTPLTMMRGYIEVFEDEIGPTLDPEMKKFMHRMNAAAQQLTVFVGNILNIARVEGNDLKLNLQKEDWKTALTKAIDDVSLRAKVRGKEINLSIDDSIPQVGIDKAGINEVVNNLIENAIKYSASSNQILVRSFLNSEGMVETSIQDHGVGIPQSILPHLFEKFYRSHRTKGSAAGTGLGLYLCKAIITAHGGNIWVQSKEGEGSTFSFTILPYDKLSEESKKADQDGIMRGAHGWIKNHNLYKR